MTLGHDASLVVVENGEVLATLELERLFEVVQWTPRNCCSPCMVNGAWCMLHGAWCMVNGAWCMLSWRLLESAACLTAAHESCHERLSCRIEITSWTRGLRFDFGI